MAHKGLRSGDEHDFWRGKISLHMSLTAQLIMAEAEPKAVRGSSRES